MSGWEDAPGGWEDASAQRRDPKIGQPEELTWAEKLVSSPKGAMGAFLDSWGDANIRGSAVGRVAKGLADPGAAVVQMAANALPGDIGADVNRGIKEREDEYQGARKAAGSEGFDPLRVGGRIGMEMMAAPLRAARTGILPGAIVGGASGALDPVVDGGANFWSEKAEQAGTGAAIGGAMSPVLGALSRIVSPKASTNADLRALRDEGIQPTIGQAAGGAWNKAEQLATSVPLMGPMVARARRKSFEDFNEAILNRAVEPVGGSVKGSGHEAVKEAGDILSDAYQQAVAGVNHINFATPAFNAKLAKLEKMAQGLMPGLREKFTATVDNVIGRKISPNGSMLGSDLKAVDSELGKIAAAWKGSSTASEREFGDAILQLKTEMMDAVKASDPGVSTALKNADRGWAWLARAEGAAKQAVNSEGVFTPAQFNQAVRQGDKSVRKRATARGTALGQDIGGPAQTILGNTVPDSGTAARTLQAVGIMGAGALQPGLLAGGAAGALLYTRHVQNYLLKMLADRPEAAPAVANYLRRLQSPATLAAVPFAQEFD